MRLASIGLPTLDIPSTPSGPEGSSGSGLNRCWGQAGGGLFSGLRRQARTNRTRQRRGGRAVECTGLENRQGLTPFEGSNPSLSATHSPASSRATKPPFPSLCYPLPPTAKKQRIGVPLVPPVKNSFWCAGSCVCPVSQTPLHHIKHPHHRLRHAGEYRPKRLFFIK